MTQQETALAPRETSAIMESVMLAGDLAKLTSSQRVTYYREVCRSLGLNELTTPFSYLVLNGKLVLYANRTCTDQLRSLRHVSVVIAGRERIDDVYVVTARATLPDGRTDESTGVVSLAGLRGDALANALMKAESKAKRRVTLSVCGLGWMDETETETVQGVRRVSVEPETGEIREEYTHDQDAYDARPRRSRAAAAPETTVEVEQPAPPAASPDEPWHCAACGDEYTAMRWRQDGQEIVGPIDVWLAYLHEQGVTEDICRSCATKQKQRKGA